MLSVYSPSNESAFGYAFALAIKQHLIDFESKLSNQTIDADQSEEETIRFQDIISHVQQVAQFVFGKILVYYREQDITQKDSLTDSLAFNFENILLGPKLSSFNVQRKLRTEQIIEKVEATNDKKRQPFWLFSECESELGEKFALILKNVFKIHKESLPHSPSKGDFENLSLYSGEYLKGIITNLADTLNLTQPFVIKIDNVVNELCDKTSTSDIPIERLYNYFKEHVISHLELIYFDEAQHSRNVNLIYKLREQGNNLMSNSAFAQAIKIYTNALDLSSFAASNNIPQLLTNRAIAYIGLNCFPEAITDLNEAVNFDTAFTPAWTQLGYCHLYMGTSLVALKAYLIALKCAVGEILPDNFPSDNKGLVEDYESVKIKSVLPQFVQRLSQSITLTERRAKQQRESSSDIKKITNEVRRILSKLKAHFLDVDSQYFVYPSGAGDTSFISLAERVNRSRPNILNQEVAQNMLANNGMETVTVTAASRDPLERFGRNNASNNNDADNNDTNNNDNNNNDNNRDFPSVRNIASTGVRDVLNEFGDLFEGRIEIQGEPLFSENAGSSSRSNENNNSNERNSPNLARNENNSVRDVLRGILPGSLGNLLSQTLSGSGTSNRIIINGQEINPSDTNPRNPGTSRPETTNDFSNNTNEPSNTTNHSNNHPDEDVDMPEVPEDLD